MSNMDSFYMFKTCNATFLNIPPCQEEKTERQPHLTLVGGGLQTLRAIQTHCFRVLMKQSKYVELAFWGKNMHIFLPCLTKAM